jgi:hypothetical protein
LSQEITQVTRRAIIDNLTTSNTPWHGRLDEADFLARIYDLTTMPSTDRRFSNAAGDIRQHRINNYDWVFYDSRFNLLHAPDDGFVRFLCETIHPVVRADVTEARSLADAYNHELAADGWELIEVKQISGRPVFAPGSGAVE